jgi:hypothetical protein
MHQTFTNLVNARYDLLNQKEQNSEIIFEKSLNILQIILRSHSDYFEQNNVDKNLGFASPCNGFVWLFLYRLILDSKLTNESDKQNLEQEIFNDLIQKLPKETQAWINHDKDNKLKNIIKNLASDEQLVKIYENYCKAGGKATISLNTAASKQLKLDKEKPCLFGIPVLINPEQIAALSVCMESLVKTQWLEPYETNDLDGQEYLVANSEQHKIEYDVIEVDGKYHVLCCPTKKEESSKKETNFYFIKPCDPSKFEHVLLNYPAIIDQFKSLRNESTQDKLKRWHANKQNDDTGLTISGYDPATYDKKTILNLKAKIPTLQENPENKAGCRLKTEDNRLGPYRIFYAWIQKIFNGTLVVKTERGLDYDITGATAENLEEIACFGARSVDMTVDVTFMIKDQYYVICDVVSANHSVKPTALDSYAFRIVDPTKLSEHTFKESENLKTEINLVHKRNKDRIHEGLTDSSFSSLFENTLTFQQKEDTLTSQEEEGENTLTYRN